MTRIASTIAFVALIGFAVGCADNSPKPVRKASAQKKAEARAEGFVIEGDDDTPKPVNPPPPPSKSSKPEKPTKQPSVEAAKPVKNAKPAKPVEPPKIEEPTLVVSGGFFATKEKAKESAIGSAVGKVHEYLLDQQPQVHRYPTEEMIRKMIITHKDASEADRDIGKVTEDLLKTGDTMYQVEIAIKVRPEHVRSLRSDERSKEALWILAGLGGLAAVFAIFFKIDSWTKGYLTSWLVLGTVGAAALVGGMWWFAK